jgi:hypothetical protein
MHKPAGNDDKQISYMNVVFKCRICIAGSAAGTHPNCKLAAGGGGLSQLAIQCKCHISFFIFCVWSNMVFLAVHGDSNSLLFVFFLLF